MKFATTGQKRRVHEKPYSVKSWKSQKQTKNLQEAQMFLGNIRMCKKACEQSAPEL